MLFQRIFFFIGILMVLVFLVLGLAILIKGDVIFPDLPGSSRVMFGILLIVYGTFRAYRYYGQWKSED